MTRRPFGAYKAPTKPKTPPPPRNLQLEAVICNAINGKRVVSFRYRATDRVPRVFEPLEAWVTEDGSACVHGVQVQSETGGSEISPQTFTIAKLRELRATGATFQVRPPFDYYKPRPHRLCIVHP